jgi:hypothetical protein
MKISKRFLITILTMTFAGFIALDKNDAAQTTSTTNQKVHVQIQIVADSSNFLQANLEVPAGTSARDLMDRLFKMSYVDFMHRFVNGIAGFSAPPREKKFWKLEIDGKDSEVGIAEIKINKPMQIRWVMAEIK